ncbi:MAG: transcriptional regulator, partial [Caulobacteraceae bacterium]|nr:transcriptional regulator [Caulobacteraceae bacterium]
MTGKVSPDEDVRLAEASDWLVRLQGDDVSETDALDFDAWLQAAPENIRAYDQVLTAWHAFGGGEQTVLDELAALEQRRIKQGFGRRWLLGGVGGAVAAAALAAVVLPGMLLEPAIQSYATGKGERQTVKLADGSTVDLNAQTRLSVTLARHERHVAMGEGEAIFDVAADARRPFLIQAGDHTVRVVGTQFNVRNRADGLAVTVARGVVEVRATG